MAIGGSLIVCNRTMDVPCLLTALLFFLSNGLNILLRSKQFNGDKDNGGQYTYAQFLELDSEYLAQKWQDRYDMRGLMTCANLFNAMAWFLLCIPILQVAWILSRAGKRRLGLHVSIALLTLCGSLTELVSRLMTIGMYNIGLYLARDFNLNNWVGENANDGIGWKTLEVTTMLSSGMLLWIDAFEWLVLFAALILICMSVKSERIDDSTFNGKWASMGLVIALFSVFDFVADVLRLVNWSSYAIIAMVISSINTLCLLPMWLLWLGVQLPTAKIPYDYEEFHDGDASDELELSSSQQKQEGQERQQQNASGKGPRGSHRYMHM